MPVNYNFSAASEKEQKTYGRTFFWMKIKMTKQKNQISCSIDTEVGREGRQGQRTSAVLQNHILKLL